MTHAQFWLDAMHRYASLAEHATCVEDKETWTMMFLLACRYADEAFGRWS